MLNTRSEKNRPTRLQPGEAIERAWGAISEGGAEILERHLGCLFMLVGNFSMQRTDCLAFGPLEVAILSARSCANPRLGAPQTLANLYL